MSGFCRPHPQQNQRSAGKTLTAELETVRVSKSPTTVVAANGKVLTKEEATVYVHS